MDTLLTKGKNLYHRDGNSVTTYRVTAQGTHRKCPSSLIPADAKTVRVEMIHGLLEVKIVEWFEVAARMWRDVTSPQEIEKELLARNKRHLQQMDREGGPHNLAPMSSFQANYGINPATDQLLRREYQFKQEVSLELATWAEAVKQHRWRRPYLRWWG